MAGYNNRVIYPEEVDKLKKEAERKLKAESNCNAIYFSDECEESQPTEAPEIKAPKKKAPEEEVPEEEAPEEEEPEENSNAIVFPDEEYEENI